MSWREAVRISVTGDGPGLLRSTATITAWNTVSRITGFVRVLAVGAALGATFLGNTYQSSNLVSNLLFDVLAAGLLSAPLVPVLVPLLDRGRREEAERVAGTVLSVSLVGLGVVVVVAVSARTAIMRLLTLDVHDAAVRSAEVRLGVFLLWFFLPQVLLYAVGAVMTALMHAARRFAAAAAAPVANNVAVTITMVAFLVMRHGTAPGLVPGRGQRLVLAVGTTAGVAAMATVPLVAAWRAGLRPRLCWELRRRELHLRGRRRLPGRPDLLRRAVQRPHDRHRQLRPMRQPLYDWRRQRDGRLQQRGLRLHLQHRL